MSRHCLVCSKDINHKNAHAKFCSGLCYNKYNRKPEDHARWNREYRLRKKSNKTFEETIRGQALALGFKSGFERTLAYELNKANVKFEYESLKLPYTINHVYKPDFVLSNGVIIEAKGILNKRDTHETAKMVAVKKQHPHLDIRFVFMDAHKPIARQKQSHAKWADKYGFPWADGSIPKDWLT